MIPRFRAATALVALSLAIVAGLRPLAAALEPGDFRAFYCAGRVTSAGADPYRLEPLRSCENALVRERGEVPAFPDLAVPAPLPAYDIALVRLFALLDFPIATALFDAFVLLASVVTVIGLQRMTGIALLPLVAIFLISDTYLSLLVGQIATFSVALAVLGAGALMRGRWTLAAVSAAGTLVEPHLGLPVVLAVALFAPQTRKPLAWTLAGVAAISAVALPIAQSIEFVTMVLPMHVATEVVSHEQLSLTNVLWLVHVPDALAIRLGGASYLVVTAFGLLAVRRLAESRCDPLIVLLPLALAPIAGPYVHSSQVCAALPFLALATRRYPAQRFALAPALALLAVPWNQLVGNDAPVAVAAFAALIAFAASAGIARFGVPVAAVFAGGAVALTLALHAIGTPHRADHAALAHGLAALAPQSYADDAWRLFNSYSWIYDAPNYVAARAPTWLGELVVLIVTARCASRNAGSRLTRAVAAGEPGLSR